MHARVVGSAANPAGAVARIAAPVVAGGPASAVGLEPRLGAAPAVASPRRALVLAWLIYVLTVWIIAAIGAPRIEPLMTGAARGPIGFLSAWDGANYTDLAVQGYARDGYAVRNVAFFPLLPAIARALGGAEHAALAGILISQFLLLGVMLMLTRWSDTDRAQSLLGQPGFWLLVQPIGFFFAVFYAESLFLFLALAGWIAYRDGKPGRSAAALVLAGLTRPSAVVLPALFLADAVRARERARWHALVCAVAPLAGVALYVLAIGAWLHEPLAYFRIQQEAWSHAWALPFAPLLDIVVHGRGAVRGQADLALVVGYAAAAVALIGAAAGRLDRAFLAYIIAGMLFIGAQIPFTSSPRYVLTLFPFFVVLARTRCARGAPGFALAGAMLVLQVGFLLRFGGWRWVA